MKKVLSIVLPFLCGTFLQLSGQDVPDDRTFCVPVRTTEEKELAFQAGEHLKYSIHYTWGSINSDVGYAEVFLDTVVFNGRKAFHCNAYGRTSRFFDFFFKVRENFQSWFTRDGMTPLRFIRDTHEGRYVAKNNYLYLRNADEQVIKADLYSSKKGSYSMDIPLTDCTYDLPALFYFARNMDFDRVDPGRKYPMTFAIDDDVYNVYFIFIGRETVKIKGLGTVKAVKFGAKLLEGEIFAGDEDMLIWISDDENRILVKFEAPILVGLVSGKLAEYSGLKHPFESLKK